MRRIRYVMEFTGRGEQRADGENIWITASSAPSAQFSTMVGAGGVDAAMTEVAGGRAQFDSEVVAADGGPLEPGKPFREYGTIAFGPDHVLRFDTVGTGRMDLVGPDSGDDDGLMQGGIVWKVEGGTGMFEGATGIITSNFAVDSAGDVTDYHVGVIYVT